MIALAACLAMPALWLARRKGRRLRARNDARRTVLVRVVAFS